MVMASVGYLRLAPKCEKVGAGRRRRREGGREICRGKGEKWHWSRGLMLSLVHVCHRVVTGGSICRPRPSVSLALRATCVEAGRCTPNSTSTSASIVMRFPSDTHTLIDMLPVEVTLIVAATRNMGIGRAGALPWTGLKKEMAYFARVTKRLAPTASGGDGDSASTSSKPRLHSC